MRYRNCGLLTSPGRTMHRNEKKTTISAFSFRMFLGLVASSASIATNLGVGVSVDEGALTE